MAISLPPYVATFSGQFYFWRSYFILFQSNYFDTTVTFSDQLFLQGSCFFFWGALFSEQSLFSKQLFFQKSYFFGAKLLPSSYFLRIGSSLGQLLLAEELFRIKISTEELPFRSRYFCTASNFIRKATFWKKLIFQKSNIPHYFFWRATFLIAATFSEELLFYNILIQKSYYFAAT